MTENISASRRDFDVELYRTLVLYSLKQFTGFRGFKFSAAQNIHIGEELYVDYCENYEFSK